MTMETTLFTAALGLTPPWEVTDIRFDADAKQVDIDVGFPAGSRFACPSCGAVDKPVHDTRPRSWQHLHFFEHRAYIHADVPRVRCEHCGTTRQVEVPWSRPGSGFTQLFEAMVITLCQQMPVNAVARLVGVSGDAPWRILDHHVERARAEEDFSKVRAVGIDETAARRGHDYITLLHDLAHRRVLYACEGRDKTTVARFVEDLCNHGGSAESVEAVCIDMSKAYIAGVAQHLPRAAVTFDRFHAIQLANAAPVRRQKSCSRRGTAGRVVAGWSRSRSRDAQGALAGPAQQLRIRAIQRQCRGNERNDSSGQGTGTRLPNHPQPRHHGVPHRRQAQPAAGVTLQHNILCGGVIGATHTDRERAPKNSSTLHQPVPPPSWPDPSLS